MRNVVGELELDQTLSERDSINAKMQNYMDEVTGKWGVKVNYLGTSVPVEKLVDAAVELNANAILASTIISHDNIHYKNMKRINELAIEKGIRDKVIIAAGGTQVIPEDAVKTGIDAGFGRDSHGIDVATFLAEEAMRRRGELPKEDKEEK